MAFPDRIERSVEVAHPPAKPAIDLPLAFAIAGLGVLIVITPSLVPGLSPPM